MPLVLLIISLSLAGGFPGLDGAHSLAPADTTAFQLGLIDIRPGSHAIVRGHDLTGRVTASYRAGTAFLNGVTWQEHLTRQEAAGSLRGLETYMTSPQGGVAIYARGGSMLAAGQDAEACLKALRELATRQGQAGVGRHRRPRRDRANARIQAEAPARADHARLLPRDDARNPPAAVATADPLAPSLHTGRRGHRDLQHGALRRIVPPGYQDRA
jgi:hypothetical protein